MNSNLVSTHPGPSPTTNQAPRRTREARSRLLSGEFSGSLGRGRSVESCEATSTRDQNLSYIRQHVAMLSISRLRPIDLYLLRGNISAKITDVIHSWC